MAKKEEAPKAAKKEGGFPKADKAEKAPKKQKGEGGGGGAKTAIAEHASSSAGRVPRMREKYKDVAIPAMTKEFGFKNPNQLPRLEKIVVNMGLGAAVGNPKIIDSAVEEMKMITGQKPVVTRAKKAIATFKLRAGLPIGVMVTLRKDRMWEFLDRVVTMALPRVRDFKGVSPKGFDGHGNYTLGLKEQIIFPEIDYDRIDAVKGMNISFVTTARTDEHGRSLLKNLGMPFRA